MAGREDIKKPKMDIALLLNRNHEDVRKWIGISKSTDCYDKYELTRKRLADLLIVYENHNKLKASMPSLNIHHSQNE